MIMLNKKIFIVIVFSYCFFSVVVIGCNFDSIFFIALLLCISLSKSINELIHTYWQIITYVTLVKC